MGKSLRGLLEERGVALGPIGLVGGQLLPAVAYNGLTQSLDGFPLQGFDAALSALRAAKRPREIAAVRTAMGIARGAAAAAETAFAAGASNARALVEAERFARGQRRLRLLGISNLVFTELDTDHRRRGYSQAVHVNEAAPHLHTP